MERTEPDRLTGPCSLRKGKEKRREKKAFERGGGEFCINLTCLSLRSSTISTIELRKRKMSLWLTSDSSVAVVSFRSVGEPRPPQCRGVVCCPSCRSSIRVLLKSLWLTMVTCFRQNSKDNIRNGRFKFTLPRVCSTRRRNTPAPHPLIQFH